MIEKEKRLDEGKRMDVMWVMNGAEKPERRYRKNEIECGIPRKEGWAVEHVHDFSSFASVPRFFSSFLGLMVVSFGLLSLLKGLVRSSVRSAILQNLARSRG